MKQKIMSKNILAFILILFSFQAYLPASNNDIDPEKEAPKGGSIKGIVIDSSSGRNVEYASIALHSIKTKEIVQGELSDLNGFFDFENVKPGKYLLKID